MTYIYKITNLLNNKSYIGLTKRNPKFRWWEHSKPSRKKISALTNAIVKYGKENFKFEVILETDEPSLMEQHFIEFYNTVTPNGYNLTFGGEQPIFTEEECKRRSERRKKQAPPIPKGFKQTSDWVEKRVTSRRKPVLGTNLETKEIIELSGATEIKKAGFTPSVVFQVANGKMYQCFGYTWEFKNLKDKKQPFIPKQAGKNLIYEK